MSFCKNCGSKLSDGAAFCSNCGSRVADSPVRNLSKCPHCGEPYDSFSVRCKLCGYEFRNIGTSTSLTEFRKRLAEIDTTKRTNRYQYRYITDTQESDDDLTRQKIDLISTFPIPNTKEDILEFMILAHSNFDANVYLLHLYEDDISDAWLAKIKQCYEKARLLLTGDFLKNAETLYYDTMRKIGQCDDKKSILRRWFKKK